MPEEHGERRARAFWSGTVSFGLVSIPVDLYPASTADGVSLRMLAPDGTPLRRRYVDAKSGKEVPWERIVRGYELEDGDVVALTEEELEGVAPEKSRDIDLKSFVDADQLDPVFFERAYVLAPAGDSNKAYRLLAGAMEKAGQAGIATFVMRTKEYLVAILASDGILRAETLHFADEVRTSADVGLGKRAKAPAKAVKAMEQAIAARSKKAIDEDELRDDDDERLLALAKRKRKKGEDVVHPRETADEGEEGGADVIDLMEVLKKSLKGEPGGRAGPRRAERRGEGGAKAGRRGEGASEARLRGMSKAELYERAQELDIPGRSSMDKDALARAIEKAS